MDKENLNITLIDDSVTLNDFNYEFKIKYFEHDYSDFFFYIRKGKIKYSIEAYIIYLKLLLIILANYLIILPYKRIIKFVKMSNVRLAQAKFEGKLCRIDAYAMGALFQRPIKSAKRISNKEIEVVAVLSVMKA